MILLSLHFLTLCVLCCSASVSDDTKHMVFKGVQDDVFHVISLPPEQRKLLPKEMQEHFDQELEKRAPTIIANTNMHAVTTGNPTVRQEIIMITGVMPNDTMHFNPTVCVITQDANNQWSVAHTHPLTLPAIVCQDTSCTLQESSFLAQPNKELPHVGGFFRYKSSTLGPERFHHIIVRWDGHNKTYVLSDQTASLPLDPAPLSASTKPAENTASPSKALKDKDGNPTVIAPNFSTGGGGSSLPDKNKKSDSTKEASSDAKKEGSSPQQQKGGDAQSPSGGGKGGGSGLGLPSLPSLPNLPSGGPSVPKSLPKVPKPQAPDADAPVAAPDAEAPVAAPDANALQAGKAPEAAENPLIPKQNLHLKGAGNLQELGAREFSIDLHTLTAAGI